MTVTLTSVLTCPSCGHAKALVMPTDACAYFHECAGCHVLLRPQAGDCCVFCSYGSVPCPPIQAGSTCGDPASVCCAAPDLADVTVDVTRSHGDAQREDARGEGARGEGARGEDARGDRSPVPTSG